MDTDSELQVSVRSLVPLAISDHLARKTSYQYGVIVGKHASAAHIIAFDIFDLKVEQGRVDLDYLRKRLQLLQVVSPHLSLIGLYTCMENGQVDGFLAHQIRQDQTLPEPLIVLVPLPGGSFKCYSLASNKEIKYTLTPGEAEEIAVSSTLKHPEYSQNRQDLILDNETNLMPSLHQLSVLVSAILERPSLSAEAERSLVHLAHTIKNYNGPATADDHSLITSHLSLLTSQVAAIYAANEHLDRQIAGTNKGRLMNYNGRVD